MRIIKDKSIEMYERTAVVLQQYAELLYAVGENKHERWQAEAAYVASLSRRYVDLLHLAIENNRQALS